MVNQVGAGTFGAMCQHRGIVGWHEQSGAFAKHDGWPKRVQFILSILEPQAL